MTNNILYILINNNIFYLERICLYNREIILAVMLRQNSKTNMTKNREYDIFAISLHP